MIAIGYVIFLIVCQRAQLQRVNPQKAITPLLNRGQDVLCTTEEGAGVCTYQLSCQLSKGRANGICRSKYGYGVCCLPQVLSTSSQPDMSPVTQTTESTVEIITTEGTTTKIPVAEDEIITTHSKYPCGLRARIMRPNARIVNGTKAKIGEFPWQVSIRTFKSVERGFEHQCGGVLLNEEWVATAAHCIARKLSQEIQVRVGEHNQAFTDPIYPHKDYKIIEKIIHPHFLKAAGVNHVAYEADIAMVRLSPPVKAKKNILPICLPGINHMFEGRKSVVTGWGKTRLTGEKSNILQKVALPILSNTECEKMYSRAGFPQSIPDVFLCAGYQGGGADACSGDSGGPLHITSADGRVVLVGLVSWGNGCGDPNKPGVYTRITEFVPWILEKITQVR